MPEKNMPEKTQSELQQISGKGKLFEIAGEKYEVLPATLEQLEEIADLWNEKVHPVIVLNFTQKAIGADGKPLDGKDKKEALYKLLNMAFDGQVSADRLRKLRRDQVKEVIDFFLID